jgi:tetratricopeptide (TPR) repeat protein
MAKIFWLALFLAMLQPAFCGEAADLLNHGVEKFHKGDFDGAIADYSKAIELKPDDPLGYYNRGIAKKAKSDDNGAIADYDKAIELNPKHAEAYYNRGNAKRDKTNGLDSAVLDFSKAIQLKPYFPEAHNNRGVARALKGGVDEAMADFTKAIESNPALKLATTNQGRAKKMKEGELAPVIDWLNEIGDPETFGDEFLKGLGVDYTSALFRRKIYTGKKDKSLFIAAVGIEHRDVILSRQLEDRSGFIWLTSRTGKLRTTVSVQGGKSLKIVQNEPYMQLFLNQKRFYLNLAIVASPDANPSRASD